MYFVIFGTDKEDVISLRKKVRPDHRQHLRNYEGVKVLYGGPTMDNENKNMNGTLLIVEADGLEIVKKFAEDDPYYNAGIFKSVSVRPWNWTLGNPQD